MVVVGAGGNGGIPALEGGGDGVRVGADQRGKPGHAVGAPQETVADLLEVVRAPLVGVNERVVHGGLAERVELAAIIVDDRRQSRTRPPGRRRPRRKVRRRGCAWTLLIMYGWQGWRWWLQATRRGR